jgi:hypothetical protein
MLGCWRASTMTETRNEGTTQGWQIASLTCIANQSLRYSIPKTSCTAQNMCGLV